VSPHEIVRPDGWPRPSGYADGIIANAGRVLHVSGQIGWDPESSVLVGSTMADQAAQALRNVIAVLAAAGGAPSHVTRLTWYVTERDEYIDARKQIGASYRELFGTHYPAMSVVVVSGLVEKEAKVEIEATAVLPE
jgi:enamine deaminase RidA (YjgF/YER057c/UK114 family)